MIGVFFVLLGLLAVVSSSHLPYVVDPVQLAATNYQQWAHLHWAWLKNSDGNQTSVMDLINGYKQHNIPLGAVNIDSTWATQYNNFMMDPTRFPDFPALVKQIHDEGLKVILWATSMVNTENPDYDFAVQNKFLIRNSHGFVRPLKWWHGSGGLLDYSNPDAVAWWHGLMDRVLDAGVDGFKCDGTDPYIIEYTLTGGALGYQDRVIDYPEYAHMYYRDFLYYTREKRAADGPNNSDAGLIMSRPVDCNLDGVTKLCTPFSPKDVMMSGWVGDDDATFQGMEGCLRKTIYSAWMNYANFGCDIGGYRGKDSTFSKTLFLRWAQLGAFMSLMENGGGGEHRPWMYDEETVDVYRRFTVQHHRLAPYMHTMGANALDQKTSTMHPVDEQTIDANSISKDSKIVFPQPRSYSYRLGDDLLVHPVVFHAENKTDAATVHMTFPTEKDGSTATWLDWWRPNEQHLAHSSGDVAFREVPLQSYAVYVREGALLPLYAASVGLQGEDEVDMNRVMFTWFHPKAAQATESQRKRFDMRESVSTGGAGIRAEGYYTAEGVLVGELSARDVAGGFEFVGIEKPSKVDIENWEVSPCVDLYNPLTKTLQVSCRNLRGGMRVRVYA